MEDTNLSDVASLLLEARGPRDAARRTLAWLLDHTDARSIGIWRTEGEGLALELSCAVDQDTLDGAAGLWAKHSKALVAGSAAQETNHAMIPTRPPGYFVYLDGIDPKRVDFAFVADGGAVALKALHRSGASLPSRARSGGLHREELLATLRLHEWNLARVARVKGVSRKTIYDWLVRYDIPRERIPKS